MAERGERAEHAGIADQDIELAVALVERRAEPSDAVGSLRSSGTSVAVAAGAADRIVEFLKPAYGARHRDHMRAGLRASASAVA